MGKSDIKIDIKSVKEIIKDLGLGRTGEVQKYATHRARVHMDKHVPMRTGTLKDTAQENYDEVIYNTPYARAMYYGYYKDGTEFNFNQSPQRGAEWDKKMMGDSEEQLFNDIQEFVNKQKDI